MKRAEEKAHGEKHFAVPHGGLSLDPENAHKAKNAHKARCEDAVSCSPVGLEVGYVMACGYKFLVLLLLSPRDWDYREAPL